MFDEDSDGFINKSQLPVLLMSLGSNPTQREMKEMMGTMKFKRRDKVSCNEFLYILQKASGNLRRSLGMKWCKG